MKDSRYGIYKSFNSFGKKITLTKNFNSKYYGFILESYNTDVESEFTEYLRIIDKITLGR